MKNRFLFCVIFLLLSANSAKTNENIYELFIHSLLKCNKQEFKTSLDMAYQIRQKYPEEPIGVFALIMNYQTIMATYRVNLYQIKVDSLLEISIDLAKKAIKKNKKDGKNYFYLATSYGARSAGFARRGEWIDAFRDGTRVESNYKKAIKYSPDFYDSYYGLGAFNYWISVKTKILAMFGNRKEQGIEQVKIAVDKAKFLGINAKYGLAAIYFNEEQYEAAIDQYNEIEQKFPENPTIHHRKGLAFKKLRNIQLANESFLKLHEILFNTEYRSISYQVIVLYHLADCAYRLDALESAQNLCRQALKLKTKCDFSKELDGNFEKYDDVLEDLTDLEVILFPE